MAGAAGDLPCLVSPSEVAFTADSPGAQKQVLTIFNPYEVDLSFKILCTSPVDYSATPSSSPLPSKTSFDVVVRARPGAVASRRDRFLIEMRRAGSSEGPVLGKKARP